MIEDSHYATVSTRHGQNSYKNEIFSSALLQWKLSIRAVAQQLIISSNRSELFLKLKSDEKKCYLSKILLIDEIDP